MQRLVGKQAASINYRHVIDSLVRKPGAFADYRFREEMFPSSYFRFAYDRLRSSHAGAVADKMYLQILKLAADESQHAVQSVLAKLSLCRTHVLGGRKLKCADGDEITSLYNSCGDGHCPTCSGGKRVDFHDKATTLILHGVTYYQVVFTLPGELSELALANRHEMADLLVGSAWKSLSGRNYLVDADQLRSAYRKQLIAKLRRLWTAGKLQLGGKFEHLRSDENWESFSI